MNEIVYVKAIVQGEIASGQKLVKLVAQNTDGIRPFYTDPKDLIYFGVDLAKSEDQEFFFYFPVEVGTCLYIASKFYEKVERAEVIELHVGRFAKGFSIYNQQIGTIKLSIKEIGKHLFFTKEEAEAALKKM